MSDFLALLINSTFLWPVILAKFTAVFPLASWISVSALHFSKVCTTSKDPAQAGYHQQSPPVVIFCINTKPFPQQWREGPHFVVLSIHHSFILKSHSKV